MSDFVTPEEEEVFLGMSESVQEVPDEISPFDTQVGGGHYLGLVIQPVEYCHFNQLGVCESNVVKYVTRWDGPKGRGVEDLDKAIHYLQLLKEMQ